MVLALLEVGDLEEQGRNTYPKRPRRDRKKAFLLHISKLLCLQDKGTEHNIATLTHLTLSSNLKT